MSVRQLILLLLVLLVLARSGRAQQCAGRKPFMMPDKSCANFTEVCIKKEFKPCATLLDACQQCPPSNFTILTLLDIFGLAKGQPNLTESAFRKSVAEVQALLYTHQVNLTANIDSRFGRISTPIIVLLIFILIVLLAVLIISATLCCRRKHLGGTGQPGQPGQRINGRNGHEHVALVANETYAEEPRTPGRQQIPRSDTTDAITLGLNQTHGDCFDGRDGSMARRSDSFVHLKEHIDARLDDLYAILRPNPDLDSSYSIFSFEINGKADIIDLLINDRDNIVKIKRIICSKLLHLKPDDCKLMSLKYQGNPFDDNEYLSKYIPFPSPKVTIYCEFNYHLAASDIVLLMLQGSNHIPHIIQMSSKQEISHLKEIAKKLQIGENLIIVKDEQDVRTMDTTSTLADVGLKDGDWLVEKQTETNFVIYSIFGEGKSQTIEYCNLDLLSIVKNKIAQELGCSPDTVFLIFWNRYLSNDEYLFKMGIAPTSKLKYFQMRKFENVEISPIWMATGDFSKIYEARETLTNKTIVMKKYEADFTRNLKENSIFINELITFQLMEPHKRILQLKDVFKDEDSVYISMERMTQSVEDFLKAKRQPYDKKWLSQILEGLKYLHKNQILHRNLKPSNILLDDNHDIKLSSFGLSKFLRSSDSTQIKEDVNLTNLGTCRYIAPEILNNMPHGTAADVWSYGTSLISIFTGSKPYNHLNNYDDIIGVARKGTIDLKLFPTLKQAERDLIGKCLKKEPEQRVSIEQLMDAVASFK